MQAPIRKKSKTEGDLLRGSLPGGIEHLKNNIGDGVGEMLGPQPRRSSRRKYRNQKLFIVSSHQTLQTLKLQVSDLLSYSAFGYTTSLNYLTYSCQLQTTT